eukprot:scaffold576_cov260-Pinguiococcus_pyrenoidosus.AAC.108
MSPASAQQRATSRTGLAFALLPMAFPQTPRSVATAARSPRSLPSPERSCRLDIRPLWSIGTRVLPMRHGPSSPRRRSRPALLAC